MIADFALSLIAALAVIVLFPLLLVYSAVEFVVVQALAFKAWLGAMTDDNGAHVERDATLDPEPLTGRCPWWNLLQRFRLWRIKRACGRDFRVEYTADGQYVLTSLRHLSLEETDRLRRVIENHHRGPVGEHVSAPELLDELVMTHINTRTGEGEIHAL